MAKTTSKSFLFLSLLIGFVLAGGAGFYYVQEERAARAEETARLAQEDAARQHREALYKSFEGILNDFIGSFAGEMKAYKKQRLILREIKQSYNFETLEDAKANYTLFIEDLAPTLRKSAITVMDIFPRTEARILELVEEEDAETKALFLDEWQAMKQKRSADCIAFFEIEDEMLQAYEELLKFYYVHANLFQVDPENGAIVFSRPEDAEKEKELLERITAVKKGSPILRATKRRKKILLFSS